MLSIRHYIAIVLLTLAALCGATYHSSQSHKKADSAAVRILADKGDAASQYETAMRFERGDGLPLSFAQAGYYLRLAAQQGHEQAQARIKEAHKVCSTHSPTNLDEAHACQIDAENGSPNAQVQVGVLYMTGKFLKKEPLLALPYFDFAAIHGDSRGQIMMASFYTGKDGVLTYNPIEAYAWMATVAQRTDLPDDVLRTARIGRDAMKTVMLRDFGAEAANRAEQKAQFYIQKYGQKYSNGI